MAIERWMGAALLLSVPACSRQDAAKGLSPAANAAAVSASPSGSTSAPPAVSSTAPPAVNPNAPLVEALQVATCSVRHSCALSHPGLGSSSRGIGVDLATCTRTSWSSSGPWKSEPDDLEPSLPVPSGKAPAPKAPKPTALPITPAECARIKSLVASMTTADLTAAREPAKMDTAACGLSAQCGSPPTKVFDVQRQTLTGKGHAVELIRAVYGQP